MTLPVIAIEEHFLSAAALHNAKVSDPYREHEKYVPGSLERLTDVGEQRLRSMDRGSISLQVVSHAAATLSTDECRQANDELYRAIQTSGSGHFAGFAILPISEPSACAAELLRCVQALHFVGALIDNHTSDGAYYDGEEFMPLFEAAQYLDVPIYLHPTWPTQDMISTLYSGNFPASSEKSISTSAFGWHSDVALHVLRLVASGLFDRLPRLKIIVGHMGEMLPFMLGRIESVCARWTGLRRSFREIYRQNIWITTSGNWNLDPMACILRNTPIDHILFGVDYPFSRNEHGFAFLEELKKSGLVNGEQLEAIAYRNAERLLRIKLDNTGQKH